MADSTKNTVSTGTSLELTPEIQAQIVETGFWDGDLLYYFAPNRVQEALSTVKWDTKEEIATLVSLIRNPDTSPADIRNTIKLLRECIKEPLILSGVIRKVTMKAGMDADGKVTKEVSSESLEGLERDTQKRLSTLELLQLGADTSDTLDVEGEIVDEFDAEPGDTGDSVSGGDDGRGSNPGDGSSLHDAGERSDATDAVAELDGEED